MLLPLRAIYFRSYQYETPCRFSLSIFSRGKQSTFNILEKKVVAKMTCNFQPQKTHLVAFKKKATKACAFSCISTQ